MGDGLREGEWTATHTGPLTAEQMGEDAPLGPRTDADDLARRVTLALADWKPGVYCACLGAGMDPRRVAFLPCEHAREHAAGLHGAVARSAEHEAAQGPGHE